MDWRSVYLRAMDQMFEDYGSRLSYYTCRFIARRLAKMSKERA